MEDHVVRLYLLFSSRFLGKLLTALQLGYLCIPRRTELFPTARGL